MASGVIIAEEAVRQIIYENMDNYTDETVQTSIDKAYSNAFISNPDDPRFAVIYFKGGRPDGETTFGSVAPWQHRFQIEFHIPVKGDSEEALVEVENNARLDYQEFISEIAGNAIYKCLGNNRSFHVVEVTEFFAKDVAEQNYLMFRAHVVIKELID